jgi:hypothetical protein
MVRGKSIRGLAQMRTFYWPPTFALDSLRRPLLCRLVEYLSTSIRNGTGLRFAGSVFPCTRAANEHLVCSMVSSQLSGKASFTLRFS